MSLKKALIALAIAFLIVLGAASVFSLFGSEETAGLRLKIEVEGEVLLGVPFDLYVKATNDSRAVLEASKLSLELPTGIAFIGAGEGKRIETRDIDLIEGNGVAEEKFRLVVLEGENTVRQLKAMVSYQPSALSSRFEKTAMTDLLVGPAGIRLDFETPEKVFNGEDFEMTVSYQNVSTADFADLQLRIIYPAGFSFVGSSRRPDVGNNIWKLGALKSGAKSDFTIKGNLVGAELSSFLFKVLLESNLFGQLYTVNEKTAGLQLAASPFGLELAVGDGTPEFVTYPGSVLTYRITYRNRTEDSLRDVIVRARLTGELFQISSIQSQGVLRPDNVLEWNAARVPALKLIPPRGEGTVTFSVRLVNDYPIRQLNDKNFKVRVDAEIESPTVPSFVEARQTIGFASIETKIGGRMDFAAFGYFRDAGAGILNRGPLPLQVGKPTQFSIHWKITNYATDISTFEVKTVLGGNVRFTGVIKGNSPVQPVYNERTQEVVWRVPKIIATKGVIGDPLETIFQVEATPSVNQVNQPVTLVENMSARAIDDYTGRELTSNARVILSSSILDLAERSQGDVQP